MKYTRQQIKDVSLSAASHAEALATLYQMIREEIEQERKITRRKIRVAVDMTCSEHEIALWDQDEYALAESVFAAAGWTIVDDDRDTPEAECADNCGRMAAFAEGVDKLRDLFKDVEDLAGKARSMRDGTEWQPIETAPKDGTHILGVRAYRDESELRWLMASIMVYDTCWVNADTNEDLVNKDGSPWATHWMHLPKPPKEQGGAK